MSPFDDLDQLINGLSAPGMRWWFLLVLSITLHLKFAKIVRKWLKLFYWQCNRTVKNSRIDWLFPGYRHLTFLPCRIFILTTRWSLLPPNKIFRSTRIIFSIIMIRKIINTKRKTRLPLCYKNHNLRPVLERRSASDVHVRKLFVWKCTVNVSRIVGHVMMTAYAHNARMCNKTFR